jgi:hypothetical protein
MPMLALIRETLASAFRRAIAPLREDLPPARDPRTSTLAAWGMTRGQLLATVMRYTGDPGRAYVLGVTNDAARTVGIWWIQERRPEGNVDLVTEFFVSTPGLVVSREFA